MFPAACKVFPLRGSKRTSDHIHLLLQVKVYAKSVNDFLVSVTDPLQDAFRVLFSHCRIIQVIEKIRDLDVIGKPLPRCRDHKISSFTVFFQDPSCL